MNNRLKRHNGELKSKIKSYTYKNSGYWNLIHVETFAARSEAIKREKQIKSYQGRKFIRDKINKKYK